MDPVAAGFQILKKTADTPASKTADTPEPKTD